MLVLQGELLEANSKSYGNKVSVNSYSKCINLSMHTNLFSILISGVFYKNT